MLKALSIFGKIFDLGSRKIRLFLLQVQIVLYNLLYKVLIRPFYYIRKGCIMIHKRRSYY